MLTTKPSGVGCLIPLSSVGREPLAGVKLLDGEVVAFLGAEEGR